MDTLNKATQTTDELEEMNRKKIETLESTIDDLMVEVKDSRRVFTGFQFSVSLLLFAYGLFYGLYFGKCM